MNFHIKTQFVLFINRKKDFDKLLRSKKTKLFFLCLHIEYICVQMFIVLVYQMSTILTERILYKLFVQKTKTEHFVRFIADICFKILNTK